MCAKITKVSPLAPSGGFPQLPIIKGVRFASAAAGVRYKGRTDVMLAELCPGSAIAGVFTRSATRSAPVRDCQDKLASGAGANSGGAAILVNSGNSNAFTGKAGDASVEAVTTGLAAIMGLDRTRIFTASTGVIGEPMAHDRIVAAMQGLKDALAEDKAEEAARAIMTTDTFPKGASGQVDTPAGPIRIAGFAKGSGMIAPDMATMLVYIFTDAKIAQTDLQKMLSDLTDVTFNCITVDSDTSTSDSLMLAATGTAGSQLVSGGASFDAFRAELHRVMLDLSHQVVRDGEGATKFVEVRVSGARDNADARKVAAAVANSPLVKTAIAGQDPNWGRVVMAVGKSGAEADRDRLSISFGDIKVAENGWVSPTYREDLGAEYMKAESIVIGIDMGLGNGNSVMWTCDLTHDYIAINADYRS